MSKETINFSDSWNGKLNCKCFTTFRLASPKYQLNKTYHIQLKGKHLGTATIKGMRIMKLSQVNEFISHIDTGYDSEAFKKMVYTMYKNKLPDVMKADFYYILLKWDAQPI